MTSGSAPRCLRTSSQLLKFFVTSDPKRHHSIRSSTVARMPFPVARRQPVQIRRCGNFFKNTFAGACPVLPVSFMPLEPASWTSRCWPLAMSPPRRTSPSRLHSSCKLTMLLPRHLLVSGAMLAAPACVISTPGWSGCAACVTLVWFKWCMSTRTTTWRTCSPGPCLSRHSLPCEIA